MALLDFFSKSNKTVRCAACGTDVKESEAKQLDGHPFCASCYARRTAAAAAGTQQNTQAAASSQTHPAIEDIKQEFEKAGLRYHTNHIGDQHELVAGINGKANTYQIKFICKDGGKNDVAMRVFGLTNFPEDRRKNAYPLLNKFQREYRYLRFTLDSDGDVNLEYDLPSCSTNVGASAVEILLRTMKMVDDIYPEIMRAIWA